MGTASLRSPDGIHFQLRSYLDGTTTDDKRGIGGSATVAVSAAHAALVERWQAHQHRLAGAMAGSHTTAGRRSDTRFFESFSLDKTLFRAVCDHARIVPTGDAFALQANGLLPRYWTAPTVESDPKAKPEPHQDAFRMG